MRSRVAALLIVLAAVASLVVLLIVAPGYVTQQGFPLDDAWIHAVYGRELGRSGSLAYNPGVPSTGSTSPLWSMLLAAVHRFGGWGGTAVTRTKVLGFLLHVLTALVLYRALVGGRPHSRMALAGALLVAFHPGLLSASVSGMEIPLATLSVVGLLYAAPRARFTVYAGVSALAVLARPELAVISVAFPLVLWLHRGRRLLCTAVGGLLGCTAAFGLLAARNLAVSGLPLPATFYAKVGAVSIGVDNSLWLGFVELLDTVPIMDSLALLGALGVVSVLIVLARDRATDSILWAAAFLVGLLFCAVSFVLVPPVDPGAFYHQRYILPAAPLIIGSVPPLAGEAVRWWLSPPYRVVGRVALLLLLALTLLVYAPRRYQRLTNDTRNIDDVQVAAGRSLASAAASDVVWAVDAGAIRFFGNAFVVDLMGLNTPQMLGSGAQAFLDRHRPRYIDVVPTWSSLDESSSHYFTGALFAPSTEYTVTGFPQMQRHWLVRCAPGWNAGQLTVRSRTFRFACAPPQ